MKNMKPYVSVIVPAYNAAATLRKTVDDILAQTFLDYEIVLVDDGSTDETPALCDRFAVENEKFHVLHQKNGGLSNARNNGTKVAQGEFVTYVDSDDRIDPHYLEYLVQAVKETGAPFAFGQNDRARENQEVFTQSGDFKVRLLSQREALKAMGTGALPVGAWCKLGKREVYLQNPFLEGKYYEDLSSTYRILLEHETVAMVDIPLYHYVMRGGSITGRKQTTHKQCVDYYEAIQSCWNGVLSRYPELEDAAAVLKARDLMSLYLSINRCPNISDDLRRMAKEAEQWVKSHGRKICSNQNAPLEFRFRLILFRINPALYEKIYYIGIRFKGKAIC